MLVYDMFIGFQARVDKILSASSPEVSLQDIERLLNHAREKHTKQRYGGNNVKRTAFEVTQKRVDDLSDLIKYQTLPVYSVGDINTGSIKTTYYKLPDNYWFSILERVTLTIPNCNTIGTYDKQVLVQARRHNEINTLLVDPYNKPEREYVFRVMVEDKIHLFYDATITTKDYFIGYIAQPEPLEHGVNYQTNNPNGALYWKSVEYFGNSETHQEIIDIASDLFIESVSDPRVQTFPQQLATQE